MPLLQEAVRDMYGDDPLQSLSYGRGDRGTPPFERLSRCSAPEPSCSAAERALQSVTSPRQYRACQRHDSPAMQEEILADPAGAAGS